MNLNILKIIRSFFKSSQSPQHLGKMEDMKPLTEEQIQRAPDIKLMKEDGVIKVTWSYWWSGLNRHREQECIGKEADSRPK